MLGGEVLVTTLRPFPGYSFRLPLCRGEGSPKLRPWKWVASASITSSQKQLERFEVLILDELGYVPFSKAGAELLFEVISRAYERTSLIVTTNLPFNWYKNKPIWSVFWTLIFLRRRNVRWCWITSLRRVW